MENTKMENAVQELANIQNQCQELIERIDEETFEITDEFLLGRFNSSDDYGRLKVGETYTVMVNGWRVPFLSWYRNIIEINE